MNGRVDRLPVTLDVTVRSFVPGGTLLTLRFRPPTRPSVPEGPKHVGFVEYIRRPTNLTSRRTARNIEENTFLRRDAVQEHTVLCIGG